MFMSLKFLNNFKNVREILKMVINLKTKGETDKTKKIKNKIKFLKPEKNLMDKM